MKNLRKNTKVPLNYKFYDVLLRVGITKYCKLQGKMLAGSADGLGNTSRAFYLHRKNPYIVNSVWGTMCPISNSAALPHTSRIAELLHIRMHGIRNETMVAVIALARDKSLHGGAMSSKSMRNETTRRHI